jgi:hypothetical protein
VIRRGCVCWLGGCFFTSNKRLVLRRDSSVAFFWGADADVGSRHAMQWDGKFFFLESFRLVKIHFLSARIGTVVVTIIGDHEVDLLAGGDIREFLRILQLLLLFPLHSFFAGARFN